MRPLPENLSSLVWKINYAAAIKSSLIGVKAWEGLANVACCVGSEAWGSGQTQGQVAQEERVLLRLYPLLCELLLPDLRPMRRMKDEKQRFT